ncbi:hypothetical protein MTO96_038408 [Rhipicephalus appendiculatus]
MDVTNVIGDYGKFQRNVYLFTLLREAPSAIHLVIYSFFFPTVEHWCAMPETLDGNITSEQWRVLVLSNSSSNADSSAHRNHQCEAFSYNPTEEGALVQVNTSLPCDKWEYGESYYKGSMVEEWDLVCDRAWMRSLAQTSTMVGMLVGTLMSSLGDKFLPESPRWLIAKGKMSAARKVILKACTDNRLHVDDIDIVLAQLRKKILQEEESAKRKASFLDLVRSRRMLLYTIVLVYASATGGITFYGLQLSVTSLGGDPYLTFVLAALVEIPAVLVCYAAVRWFPRRPTMLAVYAGTALCTIAVCLLSLDWVVLRQVCGIAGKMLASVSLALLWIFAAEIFPTVFRTFGVSACLVGTRIGASTAPLLLELRTYVSNSVPMGILVGFATLASVLMLLLPETFRVALPDTILESVRLGNSKRSKRSQCVDRFNADPLPESIVQ